MSDIDVTSPDHIEQFTKDVEAHWAARKKGEPPYVIVTTKIEVGCDSCRTVLAEGHTFFPADVDALRELHKPYCGPIQEMKAKKREANA